MLSRTISLFMMAIAFAFANSAELPILGWYGMPFEKVTVGQYKLAKDEGFTHLMQWAPDVNGAIKVLDCAEKAGIKLLLQSPCIEGEHPEIAVRQVKNHPGLGLYHLCDEPVAKRLSEIGMRAKAIMAEDPTHPCYMNWCGVVGKDPMIWYGTSDFRSYIALSRKEVPIPLISFDKYPLYADADILGAAPFRNYAATCMKTNWFETLEIVREVSRREKVPFWAFSLSTCHTIKSNTYFPNGNAFPTATVGGMKLQQYANLAYGAQGLQYFTYWGFGERERNFHDSPMTFDGKETFVMDRLRQVNAELQSRAFVFLGADAKDVWHSGKTIPSSTRPLPKNHFPKNVKRLDFDGAAIISHLVNGSHEYLMIVSAELHRDLTMKASFSHGVRRILTDGRILPACVHADEYVLATGETEIFEL